MIRTNKRGEVIVPFFRVGVPRIPDDEFAALLDALLPRWRSKRAA